MRAQPAMPAVLSSTAVACDLQVEVPDCSRLLELPGLVPDRAGGAGSGIRSPRCWRQRPPRCWPAARRCWRPASGPPGRLKSCWPRWAPGARRAALSGRYVAPHVATFRRVLKITDAGAVDTVLGCPQLHRYQLR